MGYTLRIMNANIINARNTYTDPINTTGNHVFINFNSLGIKTISPLSYYLIINTWQFHTRHPLTYPGNFLYYLNVAFV